MQDSFVTWLAAGLRIFEELLEVDFVVSFLLHCTK
jgi:hypothetical protein